MGRGTERIEAFRTRDSPPSACTSVVSLDLPSVELWCTSHLYSYSLCISPDTFSLDTGTGSQLRSAGCIDEQCCSVVVTGLRFWTMTADMGSATDTFSATDTVHP